MHPLFHAVGERVGGDVRMNHYLYLTVKEKSTGNVGIVISVDEIMGLAVEFTVGVKWLKENEIEIIE